MENHTAGLISLEEALARMLSQVTAIDEQQLIPITEAAGRITAQTVISPLDVPPFDNAAMDGYAIKLSDLLSEHPLTVAGKAFAGAPFHGEWPGGSCVRIMTGAPIPPGTESVIMQEDAEVSAEGVRFAGKIKPGQHIRRRGEDIRVGDAVLASGVRLGAAELPLLASLGIAEVSVKRRLRVAVLSTGDELQAVGQPLQEGQIYDTNRFAVSLMLHQLGCEVIDLGVVRDDPAALRATLLQADAQADVVISSGGVSVGEADYTKELLAELGEIGFWKLAIKPGKPFAFGRLQQSWFCGLPGNPVSATVTFYQLVQPLLAALAGQHGAALPPRQRVRTTTALKKSPGRLDFQRGIVSQATDGSLEVRSTGHQGSHIFSAFAAANCFIVLERERGSVEPGEWVDIEPFNPLLGG